MKTHKFEPKMPQLEFWYDLASNYSYLSAMRIDRLASRAAVEVIWKPFLLGPIFKAQGWDTSPFNIYPAKGNYMRRDMRRIALERDISFQLPGTFPAHSLLATRVAILGEKDGWGKEFSMAIFQAGFGNGKDIANLELVSDILIKLGVEPANAFKKAENPALKAKLRQRVNEGILKGVFGAPSFLARDGELFWGDDRLEQALDWNKLEPIFINRKVLQ